MRLLSAFRSLFAQEAANASAPLAEARARRAQEITRARSHHRPVRDLYEAQRRDTNKLLRIEVQS